jgi:hypothetical protein
MMIVWTPQDVIPFARPPLFDLPPTRTRRRPINAGCVIADSAKSLNTLDDDIRVRLAFGHFEPTSSGWS